MNGLCFGEPIGGIETAQHGYTKYEGPDHIAMPLKGRYFLFSPNSFYHDVKIVESRLGQLPDHSAQPEGLRVIEVDNISNDEDHGPAPEQLNAGIDPNDDDSNTSSGIVCPLEPADCEPQLEALLDKMLGPGMGRAAIFSGRVATADLEYEYGEPLSELKTPGFFTMAYPTIFINGSCDITIPAMTKVNYGTWVSHIYYNIDNRVTSHPSLRFVLLNIGLRHQALSKGSYLVAQQLNDAHLSIPELREKLATGDEGVPRKNFNMASTLPNTGPYWKDVKSNIVVYMW